MKRTIRHLAMTMLGAVLAGTLTACSSEDDDKPAPVLESIAAQTVTPLTEDGVMTATFTAQPAGTVISGASTDAKGVDVAGVEYAGDDMWQVTLNVSDFAEVESGKKISITLAQSDSVSATADVTVDDPYSIEGKYGLACPETFTVYDLETKQPIALPVLITAKNNADLADVSSIKLVNIGPVIGDGLTTSMFEQKAMTDEVGCFLVATPTAVRRIMRKLNPTRLEPYGIKITAKNGRTTTVTLYSFACPPESTLQYDTPTDTPTATAAELSSAGFRKEGTLDAKVPLLRIGFKDPIAASNPDAARFTQKMMYTLDSEGNKVANSMMTGTANIATYKFDYTLTGVAGADIAPGEYRNVFRYELSWEFRGRTYPRIAANINYDLNVE